jgi:ATP-dependent DNA ligase
MLWRNPRPGRSSRAPASFISPCLPTVAERAPTGPGWVHEIKHDGYRLQIHIRDNRVRLFTRNGNDWTERYPWIVEDAARLPVRRAVMDAECCCAGPDGITDFNSLHSRLNDHIAFAYVFDLLMLEDAERRQGAEIGTESPEYLRTLFPGVRARRQAHPIRTAVRRAQHPITRFAERRR